MRIQEALKDFAVAQKERISSIIIATNAYHLFTKTRSNLM